ncbi:carbohydrate-binding protein [Formosa sp. PL04]|uniref:carbohydrate-binding protein n=1 Tax=Formosa sp. PL04 TaxID=3081755 RepID=UPI00298120D7|nr:carbohydrate-binding protein [Formosa sp. PL04]MDW5290305.1 carbohydrate-binding protein [Formosa sp. PL04]
MKKFTFLFTIACLLTTGLFTKMYSQTTVSNLSDFRQALLNSDQTIVLEAGDYNITDLPSVDRSFYISGSNNIIDLTGVYINFPVDATSTEHFIITGDYNEFRGGEFENTYASGITEITDFVAYNEDRSNLANGADQHMTISGTGNSVVGSKFTVRGSFPYGYGSLYGIGSSNTFGLDKRAAIYINGIDTVIDGCEVQMQAFGHGIFMQSPSENTIIKNTLVEGVVRHGKDILAEGVGSLPYQNNYLDNEGNPIDPTDVISLCEDGIRAYSGAGSVIVENCTVKKMRGGIRLYLASSATVTNTTSIDCGIANWNLPNGGTVTNSSGNFAYDVLSDFRLSRNNTNIEWTIIPSPHATGTHNLADILGNNHTITFHRTPGPVDVDEERAIVISGSNSTIVNETEYTIILEASATGNNITTCGRVIDNGSDNTIVASTNCSFSMECYNTADNLQAECFSSMSGIDVQDISGVVNEKGITNIDDNDWLSFDAIDLTGVTAINITAATSKTGTSVEVRSASTDGTLLATLPITNTGSYDTYQDVSVDLLETYNGVTDVFFVFKGDSDALLNVDKMNFQYDPCYEASYQAVTPNYAKDFCEASEVNITTDTNEMEVVSGINQGDYIRFSNIDFGSDYNFNAVKVSASSQNTGGTIEFRLGGLDGELLSTVNIDGTEDWNTYQLFEGYLSKEVNGVQDLYLVFSGIEGDLLNLESFYFYIDECASASYNAEDVIIASYYCEASEVQREGDAPQTVGFINNEDYLRFSNFDFGDSNDFGAIKISASSGTSGGIIEVRLGGVDGELLTSVTIEKTGNWNKFTSFDAYFTEPVTGIHDLYLVCTGGGGYLFNLKSFEFYNDVLSVDDFGLEEGKTIKVSPNPTRGDLNVNLSNYMGTSVTYTLISIEGKQITSGIWEASHQEKIEMNFNQLPQGLYFLQVIPERGRSIVKKIVISGE